MSTTPIMQCASCGAPLSGQFCGECGKPVTRARCAECQTDLTPGARFCHRCGAEHHPGVSPEKERLAWTITAIVTVLTVAFVAYEMSRSGEAAEAAPPAPAMATAASPGSGSAGQPPDIGQMSPRQQFDRLFDRIMSASERERRDTVALFAPMALTVYSGLPSVDADARFHAALIHLAIGEPARARALADTILTETPNHLLGQVIRGDAAEAESNGAALRKSFADFLKAYDAEIASSRPEYGEHRPVLDAFRSRALAAQKP